ncbi:hypothetical protein HaLaN_27374 [Haematococcus lacustris]|uniref:Uncharacterized protein n=1 Tax=Haematococcus lacustris TaxID=44745 RepID=A0A6A0A8P0_HAELA|nr:hypothetical protein HaLaN_27374 [Haematococcus lacustris]
MHGLQRCGPSGSIRGCVSCQHRFPGLRKRVGVAAQGNNCAVATSCTQSSRMKRSMQSSATPLTPEGLAEHAHSAGAC